MLPILKLQYPHYLFQPKDFKVPFKNKSITVANRKSFNKSTTVGAANGNIISVEEKAFKKEKCYDIPFNELRHRNKTENERSYKSISHNDDFRHLGNRSKIKESKKYKPVESKQNQNKAHLMDYTDPIPLEKALLRDKSARKPRSSMVLVDEYGRRKVVSVIQMKEKDYRPVQSKVEEASPQFLTSRNIKSISRFNTEPENFESRFFEMNGKKYEILDYENSHEDHRKSLKAKNLEKDEFEMQQMIDYRKNWKKQNEEKDKERDELNKLVNEYIHYDTIFYLESEKKVMGEDLGLVKTGERFPKILWGIESEKNEKMPICQEKESVQYHSVDNCSDKIAEVSLSQKRYSYCKMRKEKEKVEEEKREIFSIKFPQVSEIEKMIDAYESLTDEFTIKELKSTKDFTREYCYEEGKEFLYFGGYDKIKSERKGLGVYVTKNFILEGVWVKGNLVKGAELKNYSLYKGEFKNSIKHGSGKCNWLNGEEYLGEWFNGVRQGQGLWYSKDRTESYSGEWKNGQVCGYGEYTNKNYSIYQGEFIDFKKNGKGKESFSNGDTYKGLYLEGVPSGKGKYIWNCGLIFEGDFKKGRREGKGVLTKESLFSLDGPFENEKPNGICRLQLSNGDNFNGKYIYGVKEGFGALSLREKNVEISGFWNHDILSEKI